MRLKKYSLLLLLTEVVYLMSCSTPQSALLGKRTPYEKYKSSLENAGLIATRLGILWVESGNASLERPVSVTIPYKETGYFEMATPKAAGFVFSARQGEMISINMDTNPRKSFLLFTELWEVNGSVKKLLENGDTATNFIKYEIKKDGRYIVRIQPELLQGLAYTITISSGPSLAFPVNREHKPRVISIWGDSRDGNARRHEGIDILAKKYSPVVAIADGKVTNVSESALGGKVVFLRPNGKNYNLYYAHLDTQLVQPNQAVLSGDTLGLIGNTGNAKYTVAHLHFGIYGGNGAVDPLPFVDINRSPVKPVKSDTSFLNKYARIKNKPFLYAEPSSTALQKTELANDRIVKVTGATDDFYKIELPDGSKGFVKSSVVTEQPLRLRLLSQSMPLFDQPYRDAAVKKQLIKGSNIVVLGIYENFYYVAFEKLNGWVENM